MPAILYIHGGGFFVGSIDTEHTGSASLARELGVVVVSVEYRLAPEHPFPAGIEDCYAALVWLHDHADELGVDTARIAVNGGSAGGGLAAGLALLARDRGGPALCFQYLGIPELDDRLETPSMQPVPRHADVVAPGGGEELGVVPGRRPRPRRRVARTPRRPAPPISPGSRPRTCRPWSSTRCATRASCTRSS